MLVEGRADLLRGLMLVGVFRPAAYVLPRALIRPLASACALVLLLFQSAGRRMTQDWAAAFGLSWLAALRQAQCAYGKRFNEFVTQQKAILGRFDAHALPIRIVASDEARDIIAGKGSFVLAQAHFERADAATAVIEPSVFDYRAMYVVALKLPDGLLTPHLWRVRVQLRQALNATMKVRPTTLEFVYTGGAFAGLIKKLAKERVIVSMNVDAHWPRGRPSSLSRPFAGTLNRTFSTGAAKLARLGQCPILLALPVLDREGREIQLRLLGPFRAALPEAENADTDVSQQMLDVIEREIGQRPCDYMLEIGGERRWNAQSQSWLPLPPSTATEALSARAR
jgi:lauroyl/myristoyl acyltransferase